MTRMRAPAPTTHTLAASSISTWSRRAVSRVRPPSHGTQPPRADEAAPRTETGVDVSRAHASAASTSGTVAGWNTTSGSALVRKRVNNGPRYTFWSRSASPRRTSSVTMRAASVAVCPEERPGSTARRARSCAASSRLRRGAVRSGGADGPSRACRSATTSGAASEPVGKEDRRAVAKVVSGEPSVIRPHGAAAACRTLNAPWSPHRLRSLINCEDRRERRTVSKSTSSARERQSRRAAALEQLRPAVRTECSDGEPAIAQRDGAVEVALDLGVVRDPCLSLPASVYACRGACRMPATASRPACCQTPPIMPLPAPEP